ncbi:MAG: hypothetical protein JW741_06165 [Sedimentisphaerales bacterium]|nr:hypothetical protein [Sedimentisphaerales bacterium]
MKKLIAAVTVVGVSVLVCGCGTYYRVGVNAYLDASRFQKIPDGSSFYVIGDPNTANPLLRDEVKAKIEKLIVSKGYRTASPESADYWLFFGAHMDSGKEIQGIRPVYMPGGTATVNMYGSSGHTYGTVQMPGTTSFVPYRDVLFGRWMMMFAYERPRSKEEFENLRLVWQASAVSVGHSSDLRGVVDPMLVSVFEYFGVSTGRRIERTISESDKLIRQLREP